MHVKTYEISNFRFSYLHGHTYMHTCIHEDTYKDACKDLPWTQSVIFVSLRLWHLVLGMVKLVSDVCMHCIFVLIYACMHELGAAQLVSDVCMYVCMHACTHACVCMHVYDIFHKRVRNRHRTDTSSLFQRNAPLTWTMNLSMYIIAGWILKYLVKEARNGSVHEQSSKAQRFTRTEKRFAPRTDLA
jgi:hypothetical protein